MLSSRRPVLFAATVVLGALVAPLPAGHADPRSDTRARQNQVNNDIADLQEDLAGISAELTTAYSGLEDAQQRLPAAQAALDTARAEQAEAEGHDAELAGRLQAAEQARARVQVEVEASRAAIEQNRGELGRMAAATYRSGSVSGELDVVLGAQSPQELADRYLLSGSVLTSRSATIARLGETRSRQQRAEERLSAVQAEVAELREQARQALDRARTARDRAEQAKAEVDRLVAARTSAVAAIQARKAEEDARLADLQRERQNVEATLRRITEQERAERERQARERRSRERTRPDTRPERSDGAAQAPAVVTPGGSLATPVGSRITSHYGYRIHPIYGYRRMHTGTDFAGPCGTPVRASADGRVVSAGWAGGYGNRVVVSHGVLGGESLATSYSHLQSITRSSGRVSRGEVIGQVGTTGASTGCHLHFEVFVNGSHTNPLPRL